MIHYLKGKLEEVMTDSIIIDIQGIGYQLLVPSSILSELPPIGNDLKVYTYLHVREDAMVLFGFPTKEDQQLFKLLITVNGIGPKGAMGILSALNGYQLKIAVAMNDVNAICKAPGIGKKTAQKLILDLKDKIAIDISDTDFIAGNDTASFVVEGTMSMEAIEALVALGYNSTEASKAVKNCGPSTSVETLIKEALKHLL